MARAYYSPKIQEWILLLEKGDKPIGTVAAYSENEIIMLEGVEESDLKVINDHKKVWDIRDGEWSWDLKRRGMSVPRINKVVQEMQGTQADDSFREATQDLLPLPEISEPKPGKQKSRTNKAKEKDKGS